MSDATSLRSLLTRVDATAPAIQTTAGAMMKHYDRSAEVAVVEWRNALHNSQREQWLPLLYVANEVLQNSKRNRGNKFLEAFSPVLGQSLIFVCQHSDGSVVEKIRRTVKIWGDRRVFSVRYVNELLKGLEPYRNNQGATAPPPQSQLTVHEDGTFSPQQDPMQQPATTTPSPHPTSTATTQNGQPGSATTTTTASTAAHDDNGEESDDPMDIFDDNDDGNANADEEDDDDDVFGASDGGAKLDVEINFDSSALTSPPPAQRSNSNTSGFKRRRSSTASAGSHNSSTQKKRRKSVLSTNSLSELWKQVSSLQQSFDHSIAMLKDIQLPESETLQNLVGDELVQHYQKVCQQQERVLRERQTLHRIATERRNLEQEAVRYIPWLEKSLQQDADDIQFCKSLDQQLSKFLLIHPAIREARDKRVEEDLRYRREQEEQERKRRQEEESKRFREAALSKETEAKPGMVWNKVTQEYQYLNTDESWRD